MTNCPNCGAPYALDSPVCEYCGTVREGYANPSKSHQATCNLAHMRLNAAQAQFNAAQQAQNLQLMCNAYKSLI